MFHDAREIPAGTVLQGDLAIIGAGPAGITIARQLAALRIKVILIEGGGTELDMESQALYEGENVGHHYLPLQALRSRYFGGSSNCWGGWCRPLDAIDFEKRDWVPYSGWPFGKSELDPYYDEARTICDLSTDRFDPEYWEAQLNDPRLKYIRIPDDRVITRIAQLSRNPRIGRRYADEIRAMKNVDVLLHANVVEIEASHTANSVTGLRIATLAGAEFRVEAKRYVLAAGGIENARLLLVSNRVAATGLGNQNDLVGRFFMEHPDVRVSALVPNDPQTSLSLYDIQYAYFTAGSAAYLALRDEVLRRERLLNYQAWIIAVYRGEASRGGEALKNIYRALKKPMLPDQFTDTSPSFWLRNIGNMFLDFPYTAAAAIGRLTTSPRMVEKYQFAHYCEPTPNPASRITLAPEKDRFGLNRAQLDWRLCQADVDTMRRAQEIIAEEVSRSGFGKVVDEFEGDGSSELNNSLWGWHQMGTTRMHDDPRQGVVNSDCKVHGIENFYIAGNSIFPTGGSNLPTLTIVALALRLARHLRDTFAK